MEASEIQEHLFVEADRTLLGTLRNGATITNGAQLTVNGAVTGPIHVEVDGILMVQGSFTGTIETNAGTVILSGQVGLDFDTIEGAVAVAIGSLLTTRDGPFRLQPDGQLEELTQSHYPAGSFNIRSDQVCYFDRNTRRFQPLPSRS